MIVKFTYVTDVNCNPYFQVFSLVSEGDYVCWTDCYEYCNEHTWLSGVIMNSQASFRDSDNPADPMTAE